MGYQVSITPVADHALIDVRGSDRHLHSSLEAMGDTSILHIGADQWLVRTSLNNEQRLFDSLVDTLDTDSVVTVVTDHYVGVALTGGDCNAIIAQACSLDIDALVSGVATRARFARTAAIVNVITRNTHYDIFVEASYADYLRDWLAVALKGPSP